MSFMGKRGPQPGSGGRPKKPVADKVLEGNPGKRELTVVKFDGGEKPKPKSPGTAQPPKSRVPRGMPSYLDITAKEGGDVLPPAGEIFAALSEWVASSGCADIVTPSLLEDFAFLRRGYLECEYMNRKLGRIASGKRSPYVNMALDYQKAMMAVYNQIWLIVSQNCETKYEGKNEFLQMLMNRNF
jgi:hypothetical protein